MPGANATLNKLQSRYASLTHWKPGSPESQEAGREFWSAKAIQDLRDSLAGHQSAYLLPSAGFAH